MLKSKKIKQINEKTEPEDEEIESELQDTSFDDIVNDDDDDDDDNIDDDESENEIIENEDEEQECLIEKIIEDDNYFFDNNNENFIKQDITEKIVDSIDRISPNRLTKYEMVRILGERTKQLTLGAKPMIKNYQSLSYDKIAEEELKLNMIPYKIKRPLPNGKFEIWTLNELNKEHLLSYLE